MNMVEIINFFDDEGEDQEDPGWDDSSDDF